MEGCGQYYIILDVVSSLPERVYVYSSAQYALDLNLSTVVHQGPPVMRLSEQVLTGLPGLCTSIEVLNYQRSTTQSAAHKEIDLEFLYHLIISWRLEQHPILSREQPSLSLMIIWLVPVESEVRTITWGVSEGAVKVLI